LKAQALALARDVRLTTELVDVTLWQWPIEAFAVIAVIFTQFASAAERERMFADIRAAVIPGGILLLEGLTPKQLEYRPEGRRRSKTCTHASCYSTRSAYASRNVGPHRSRWQKVTRRAKRFGLAKTCERLSWPERSVVP